MITASAICDSSISGADRRIRCAYMRPKCLDLTLEEHDWFLRGLWKLACSTDYGERLALNHESVSKPH